MQNCRPGRRNGIGIEPAWKSHTFIVTEECIKTPGCEVNAKALWTCFEEEDENEDEEAPDGSW